VGCIIDQYEEKNRDKKQRQYQCPTVVPLQDVGSSSLLVTTGDARPGFLGL
jgi:hypothetical protein